MAEFEVAYSQRGIRLFILLPHSPKLTDRWDFLCQAPVLCIVQRLAGFLQISEPSVLSQVCPLGELQRSILLLEVLSRRWLPTDWSGHGRPWKACVLGLTDFLKYSLAQLHLLTLSLARFWKASLRCLLYCQRK